MSSVIVRAQEVMLKRLRLLQQQKLELDLEISALGQAISALDLATKIQAKEQTP